MFKKDFEGEAEWWTSSWGAEKCSWMTTDYYVRLETQPSDDGGKWYAFDDYTNNLIELSEEESDELERRRDEST